MSQNDFTIANQSFPAFRADLNSALQALASNNSGTSAPSTTFANMWWYDSTNNIMYIRNEDNDAWIKFAELDQTNDKFVLSGTLQLDDGTVSAPALTFNSDTNMGIYRGGTDILKFVTAGTDAITIDASQRVGIGGFATTTAIPTLSIVDTSSGATMTMRGQSPKLAFDVTSSGVPKILMDNAGLEFKTGTLDAEGSVHVKLDSSNVLVGKTSADNTTAGVRIQTDGFASFARDSNFPMLLNRKTSDGTILDLRKDGTQVGAIQTFSDALQIGSYVGNDSFIQFVSSGIKPTNSAGTNRDNGIDLGASNARFKDLYLGGGAYIGGTGSANQLDDYEEGTWTPATSSASYNTGSSTGRYTKIGRIVVLHFSINFSAVNGGSNSNVTITGVPITPTSVIDFTGSVRENSNTGAIYVTRLGAGTTSLTMNSMDNVTNGSQRTIRTNENYGGTIVYMT